MIFWSSDHLVNHKSSSVSTNYLGTYIIQEIIDLLTKKTTDEFVFVSNFFISNNIINGFSDKRIFVCL